MLKPACLWCCIVEQHKTKQLASVVSQNLFYNKHKQAKNVQNYMCSKSTIGGSPEREGNKSVFNPIKADI